MQRTHWLVFALIAGCESVPPSGDPLAPVSVRPKPTLVTPVQRVISPKPQATAVQSQVVPDRPVPAAPTAALTPNELSREMGLTDAEPPVEASTEDSDLTPESLSPQPQAADDQADALVQDQIPPMPLAPVSWGVRVISTTYAAQPPRAILGLPDGSEQVVRPGDLLPEVSMVVLAVGHNKVQLAEITPMGDHAGVRSMVLDALYPNSETD